VQLTPNRSLLPIKFDFSASYTYFSNFENEKLDEPTLLEKMLQIEGVLKKTPAKANLKRIKREMIAKLLVPDGLAYKLHTPFLNNKTRPSFE